MARLKVPTNTTRFVHAVNVRTSRALATTHKVVKPAYAVGQLQKVFHPLAKLKG